MAGLLVSCQGALATTHTRATARASDSVARPSPARLPISALLARPPAAGPRQCRRSTSSQSANAPPAASAAPAVQRLKTCVVGRTPTALRARTHAHTHTQRARQCRRLERHATGAVLDSRAVDRQAGGGAFALVVVAAHDANARGHVRLPSTPQPITRALGRRLCAGACMHSQSRGPRHPASEACRTHADSTTPPRTHTPFTRSTS